MATKEHEGVHERLTRMKDRLVGHRDVSVEHNEGSPDANVVASIEVVRDAVSGKVQKLIKRNADGDDIRVIEFKDDVTAGTGIR
ncbi:hypothetical protein AB0G73_10690 [Streptomyces sp. NPDC020719]|uniref:hypothetical protein n=1 Tax=Streptomyces sp. NPDC020719 TaxID=3154896 RepID=UPI00340E85EC